VPQANLDFDEQQKHLKRAQDRLGTAILEFCKLRRFSAGSLFHMDDLRKYLTDAGIVFAPASPDRVLRHLRTIKMVNYRVVNRRQSLYQITWHFFEKKEK
jgi:hypothetical protein